MLSSVSTSSTTPTLQTNTAAAHSTSPRSTRFRGLSYLRIYSHHVGDRVQPGGNDDQDRPRLTRDRYTYNTPSSSSSSNRQRASSDRTRSASNETETANILSRIAARRSINNSSSSNTSPRVQSTGWTASANTTPTDGPSQDSTSPMAPQPASHRFARRDAMAMPRSHTTAVPEASAQAASAGASHSAQPIDWSGLRHPSRRTATSTPLATESPSAPQLPVSQLPSIRFVPYQDARARPSLNFATTTRTLPSGRSVIRVGRYSEKDTAPVVGSADVVSDAPVGFKSKVVSRRHCEFFYQNNQWWIKDVKSSSGTFLNHIRLSPPGEESRPYSVQDGDLVQLGIDFKGGEEMIFRCVKIRILCNRGWQKSLNKFNKSAHKHLNDLQKGNSKSGTDVSGTSTECTICLNAIAPCQSLFVAPCSHTWHYKCIRPMLEESSRRSHASESPFVCPNCRNVADLNAEPDDALTWEDSDDSASHFEEDLSLHAENGAEAVDDSSARLKIFDPVGSGRPGSSRDGQPAATAGSSTTKALNPSASNFVPTRSTAASSVSGSISSEDYNMSANASESSLIASLTMNGNEHADPVPVPRGRRVSPQHLSQADAEGPLTPRNNAGPFVLDGAAGNDLDTLSGSVAPGGASNLFQAALRPSDAYHRRTTSEAD